MHAMGRAAISGDPVTYLQHGMKLPKTPKTPLAAHYLSDRAIEQAVSGSGNRGVTVHSEAQPKIFRKE